MTSLDKLLAVLALLGFIAFLGILLAFVKQIDLTVVAVIGVALAVYDFYLSLRGRHRDTSH